jgi:hypothetical protein
VRNDTKPTRRRSYYLVLAKTKYEGNKKKEWMINELIRIKSKKRIAQLCGFRHIYRARKL